MVRLIAAGLVEVGHARISPAQFKKLLDAGDRAALPVEAAPPHGLYLQQVGFAHTATWWHIRKHATFTMYSVRYIHSLTVWDSLTPPPP